MFPPALCHKAEHLLQICREKKTHIVTAESCTGGMIGGMLTEIAGSSDVVEAGYIVYSNHAKMTLLHVLEKTLITHGAISAETAFEMATGALTHHAKEYLEQERYLSIAVTGVAGPGGGSADKPVGTVWFGCGALSAAADMPTVTTQKHVFPGDRCAIRLATIEHALDMLLDAANS